MSRLHGNLNSYVFAEFLVPPVVHTQILFKTASVSSHGGPGLEKNPQCPLLVEQADCLGRERWTIKTLPCSK